MPAKRKAGTSSRTPIESLPAGLPGRGRFFDGVEPDPLVVAAELDVAVGGTDGDAAETGIGRRLLVEQLRSRELVDGHQMQRPEIQLGLLFELAAGEYEERRERQPFEHQVLPLDFLLP